MKNRELELNGLIVEFADKLCELYEEPQDDSGYFSSRFCHNLENFIENYLINEKTEED